jgi:hypothetical protein
MHRGNQDRMGARSASKVRGTKTRCFGLQSYNFVFLSYTRDARASMLRFSHFPVDA